MGWVYRTTAVVLDAGVFPSTREEFLDRLSALRARGADLNHIVIEIPETPFSRCGPYRLAYVAFGIDARERFSESIFPDQLADLGSRLRVEPPAACPSSRERMLLNLLAEERAKEFRAAGYRAEIGLPELLLEGNRGLAR